MPLTGEITSHAREKLKGAWGAALLVCLVAMLLGGMDSIADFNVSVNTGGTIETSRTPWFLFWVPYTMLLSIYSFAVFLIGGAVELGACTYFSRLALGERPSLNALFDRFEIFLKALGLRLFMGLFIMLWSLLFVIPGIVAAYRYAMAPYFMAEYPQMGIREAVNRSKEVMDGRKGKLFLLHLSIQIWVILVAIVLWIITAVVGIGAQSMGGAVTFGVLSVIFAGITSFVLLPYLHTAEATFYLTATGRLFRPAEAPIPPAGEGGDGPSAEAL